MKKFLSVLVGIVLIGMLAACGTSDKENSNSSSNDNKEEKKVLVMGTSSDYPPFEFVDTATSDEIIGFDIDIANAIADKLGYTVEVKDIDFNGLIPALQAGQIDFVLAGMTPTEERKQNVDFSDVYYEAKHMIVSKKSNKIDSVEDLNGKTIGVQLASIQEDKAKEIAKTIDLKIDNRNRVPELVQEILAGRFDAAIIEDTVAKGYFENNKDLVGFTLEGDVEEAGSAIAFPKDSELTTAFNDALNEMKQNGELEKLIVKWFDGSQ